MADVGSYSEKNLEHRLSAEISADTRTCGLVKKEPILIEDSGKIIDQHGTHKYSLSRELHEDILD